MHPASSNPPGCAAGHTAKHLAHSALLRLQASLSEMIPPGALVMLTPVIVGVLFGTRTLAGVLAGALVSGVQMAVSMSNTGGGGPRFTLISLQRPCPVMLPVTLLPVFSAHLLPA